MLDIKLIRENPELFKKNLQRRNREPKLIDQLLELDKTRRELIAELDMIKAEKNKISKKPSPEEITNLQMIKKDTELKEGKLTETENSWREILLSLPNMLSNDVPDGKSDEENKEVRRVGEIPTFDFAIKDHLKIGADLDLLDFERGAKVAGSGFFYEKNQLALLDLSLQRYAFDKLISKGFEAIITPDLAKEQILKGIGFMPRGQETQVYSVENSDLCLVGTAEITVGGLHSDEILDSNDLPKKYISFSHCFRTEDGSYGKYSKGLYRVKQFSKVEMFVICKPEDSEKYHQELLAIQEELAQELNLPYRIVIQCTGDIAAPSAKTFDLEAWMPSRENYGEITSTSNTTDFQARRLNIRFKDSEGNNTFVHMLNGTALNNSRWILALLENNQQADGSVIVPEALRKYTGFDSIEK